MNVKSLFILLLTTVLTFSTLYTPQPILPLLAQEFSVSGSEISLLISLTLFPLGLMPIIYGYLIDNVSARTILHWFIGMLAVTELSLAFVSDFRIMLVFRLLQGLLLPAIFTAIVTYISNHSSADQRQKSISSYIAATIIGGFAGRFLTGLISDISDWRVAFMVWTVGLFAAWTLLWLLKKDTPIQSSRLSIGGIWEMFRRPRHFRVYLTIFIVFFGFSSALNALPFRIKEISASASESLIASAYLGYLMGVLVSFNAQRICARLGSEVNSTILGISAFSLGVLLLSSTNLYVIFCSVFIFCTGFFLMHSTLSGYVNQHTYSQRGVANGLYIALYYGGGSLGSYFPLIIYHTWGWYPYLLIVIGCSLGGLAIIFGLREIDKTELKQT